VRAATEADIRAVLPSGVPPSDIKPKLAAILTKRRPEGLKQLRVAATPGQPQSYDVYITASPTTQGGPINAKDPEFTDIRHVVTSGKIVLDQPVKIAGKTITVLDWARETWAVATVDVGGKRILATELGSGGGHAEQKILAEIDQRWDSEAPRPKTLSEDKRTVRLDLKVTRSPCPALCAPAIGEFKEDKAKKGWKVSASVAAIGVFSPIGGSEDGPRYPRLSGGSSAAGRPVGRAGLAELKKWDIETRVMGADDPAIAPLLSQLGPADQEKLKVAIRRWNTNLTTEITRVYGPPIGPV